MALFICTYDYYYILSIIVTSIHSKYVDILHEYNWKGDNYISHMLPDSIMNKSTYHRCGPAAVGTLQKNSWLLIVHYLVNGITTESGLVENPKIGVV